MAGKRKNSKEAIAVRGGEGLSDTNGNSEGGQRDGHILNIF